MITETENKVIDISFRQIREKFRSCVQIWVKKGDDPEFLDLIIPQVEEAKKLVDSFLDILKRKKKWG